MRKRRSKPRPTVVPPVTPQEDEERRVRKRSAAILAIKRTPMYQFGRNFEGVPATPDPRDMQVSKRQWEVGMARWRQALEQHSITSL